MSSLFRSPQSASSDSDSDSGSDVNSNDGEHIGIHLGQRRGRATSLNDDSRQGDGHNQDHGSEEQRDDSCPPPSEGEVSAEVQSSLMDLDIEGHATMMTTSLLEFYCLTRAADMLNSRPGCAGKYDRNHPRVQALGKKLYAYKSQFLSTYGVVAGGVEGDEWADVRQNYRDSLDTIGKLALDGITPTSSQTSSRAPSRGTSSFSLASMAKDVDKKAPTRKLSMLAKVEKEGSPAPPNRIPLRRQITDKVTAEAEEQPPPQGIIEMMASGTSESGMDMGALYNQVYGTSSASRYATEFEEEAMLGKGSYGAVYRARHHVDGQVYAVKKIPLSERKLRSLQEKGFHELESILKEIRTLARLEHKNVIRYFGAWVEYGNSSAKTAKKAAPHSPERGAATKTTVYEPTFLGGTSRRPTLMDVGMTQSADDMSFGDVFDQQDDDGIIFAEPSSEGHTDSGADREVEEDDPSDSTGSAHPLGARSHLSSYSPETVDGSSISLKKISVRGRQESDSEDVESIPRSFDVPRRRAHFGTSRAETPSAISEDSNEDYDIFSDGMYSAHPGEVAVHHKQSKQETPMVTLHIQMSLHPLSLARYLTPPTSAPKEDHHCFHLVPSLRLLLGILDGVEYLHSIGMVHRDLKPANIFLSQSTIDGSIECPQCREVSGEQCLKYNTPRIGDFGLVADITRKHDTSTASGEAPENAQSRRHPHPVGTEFYRPPVLPLHSYANPSYGAGQVPLLNTIDESLDVYALGVIFFELLYKFETRMERMFVLSSLTCSGNSNRLLLTGPRGRSTSISSSPGGSVDSSSSETGIRPVLPPDFEKKVDHTISVGVEGEKKELCVLKKLQDCILGLVDVNPKKRWTCEDARKTLTELLEMSQT
ncbi:eukaryotic translation initiation factor 2-alpha kinase [Ascosphaera apis ARSEF 7405]|uniref:Eukaryotic translation initiation factor 2-alpha kinase n=1 Tax=Ascosphaera apis ARSEF 7405 TaxID=392613 RepID=A0A166PEQ3_9EURO|nr:eukaryotic translation initiation factor 2-alpha kinase [Ascosphaera apis ARSEF 7405]